MLTLQQLRCFIATYEEGSLTAAADRLGYAQPSVSEQIRNLERTLGAPLFRRVGRGVVATTIADDFRAHAERTLAAADAGARGGGAARCGSSPAPSGSGCSGSRGCTPVPS